MRAGDNVELQKYYALAEVLKTDPTALCFIPEGAYPLRNDIRAFAQRVEELLDQDGTIPELHPDTGEPVDVVDWVWQLDDPQLASIRLTHREEREAYYQLRDERLRLYEKVKFVGTRRLAIGTFHVGPTPLRDILDDYDLRYEAGCKAFATLKKHFEDDDLFHLIRIATELPVRFDNYLRAKALDEDNIDVNGCYHTNLATINNLLDADFHVRKIIFPTFQQDQTFHHTYSRSRRLIHRMIDVGKEDFAGQWLTLVKMNTDDLEDLRRAWDVDLKEVAPDWELMKDALHRTIERAKQLVAHFYPPVTKTEKRLVKKLAR
ncbi:hypothetical protein [Botrimarina hoheduenensis]|nr:hypothetical protein [Botrimarina hoheduenensis]